ncbi:MAG: hypothetical protein ACRD2O_17855, partial [Terriglobia bacterium]
PNNPQSWNRYAYVGGMPLEYADPLGLHAQACTTDSCSWQDPVGCTLDGMSIGCEMVQNWAEMAGGGGMLSCGTGACPTETTLVSPVNGKPYKVIPGVSGWQYTNGISGDPIEEPELWEELGLPDFNLTYNGQLVAQVVTNWALQNTAPPEAKFEPPAMPKLDAPENPRPSTFSHSYTAFLACEYLRVMGNFHEVEMTGTVNVAPLVLLATGNVPRAALALGVMGVYDIGGAWVINSSCSSSTYGPSR